MAGAGTGGMERRARSKLVRLYDATEIDTAEIARAIGKSVSAVTSYASRMDLTSRSPTAKMRRCLGGCDRMFMSDGRGNLVCDVCKRTEAWRCA